MGVAGNHHGHAVHLDFFVCGMLGACQGVRTRGLVSDELPELGHVRFIDLGGLLAPLCLQIVQLLDEACKRVRPPFHAVDTV
jgi:hypothetical protein